MAVGNRPALDEKRRQEGLTWIALAAALGCSPSQLTGLRTGKYATTTDFAMRITQWLGRPAADFLYPAAWLALDKPPTH
jgi:transcriptional regulator with XRE-family HTH domain